MYAITIIVGPAMWSLLFKTEENAQAAHNNLRTYGPNGGRFEINDDFGQTCSFMPASLHGWMFENLDDTKMAHAERALHHQRTIVLAQKLAENDSTLSMAKRMQGPSIIDPMNGLPAFNPNASRR